MNDIRIAIVCACCAMLTVVSRGDIFEDIADGNLKGLESVTNRPLVVNSRNAESETPLMFASRLGEVACVNALVVAGADTEATSKGFRAIDQVESYLRRTGDAGRQVLEILRSDGFGEDTILAFEKEMDSLRGTPERIKSWREILEILSRADDKDRKRGGVSRTAAVNPKQQVLNDASWIHKAASNELRCARLELIRSLALASFGRGTTNCVCYSTPTGRSARSGVEKWAQVVAGDREFQIVGITCRLADKGIRKMRFYPTEAVDIWIEELNSSNRCLACQFDESGGFKWMIRMCANKVTGFWRMKDGMVYADDDFQSAMKLVEQATMKDVK